ncbi:MAG: 50S ribosomal protein L11 methyltransferase, partial [Lachnospiraceae bacterium]|nr:50S ribosomal protein L11 methyltransferase [Lachnospiraceae bacterium]
MKWIKYEVHTTTRDAEAIGELLLECGVNGYEITDHVPLSREEEQAMYTDIPKDMGEDDGSSVLTFYTEAPENKERTFYSTGSSLRDDGAEEGGEVLEPEKWVQRLERLFRERQSLLQIELPEITWQIEDDSMWKDKWKENFKPFRVAEDIVIKPSWEEIPADVREEDIVIELDPGSAFGSGTHETTKLCLLSVRKYITRDTCLLDAGCGSGILAIASVLLGAKSVFCL